MMSRSPGKAQVDWHAEIQNAFKDGVLARAVLSNPASPSQPVRKITVRPVIVGGDARLQWAERSERQETHSNLTSRESEQRIQKEFPNQFRQLNLFTTDYDLELCLSREGHITSRRSKPTKSVDPNPQHNITRNYLIPEGRPCAFLEAAGVMTADGRVRAAMQHKFRQINRFLEFVNDVYSELPASGPLHVVDFGCGKSYLTFAVHHLLAEIHKRDVTILGIDRSADVIATCKQTTEELDLKGLEFQAGDISDANVTGPVHLAVSLHACDTATDAALTRAVSWQSQVILAAPCCQHEVAASMNAPALELLQHHGILKERFAALATDALRAAALEAAGYRAQVIEFIDLDHTPKNLLIRAVRRQQPNETSQATWRSRFEQLKATLGVETVAIDALATFDASDANKKSPASE